VSTTRIGALIDALVATMTPLLPDAVVLDGVGVTGDRCPNALFVGVDDPDTVNATFAADAVQEWANANYTARDETGWVLCAASSWVGETDQKMARDNAIATVNAVENALRANPSLDIPGMLWTSVGSRIALMQNQASTGAHAVVLFRVAFRARI
jgi:hypothetical protein